MFLLVKSPVQQLTRMANQQSPLVPNHFSQQQPPLMHAPNYPNVNFTSNTRHLDLTRVDALPSGLYDEICIAFDTGPPGKNWRALAGWLGFTANQVKHFEREKRITDSIIRHWSTETGNDIEKFVSILEKYKMTDLADKIEKGRMDIHFV